MVDSGVPKVKKGVHSASAWWWGPGETEGLGIRGLAGGSRAATVDRVRHRKDISRTEGDNFAVRASLQARAIWWPQ